jgi:hypothetical protein
MNTFGFSVYYKEYAFPILLILKNIPHLQAMSHICGSFRAPHEFISDNACVDVTILPPPPPVKLCSNFHPP